MFVSFLSFVGFQNEILQPSLQKEPHPDSVVHRRHVLHTEVGITFHFPGDQQCVDPRLLFDLLSCYHGP